MLLNEVYRIKTNVLLKGAEKEMTLDEALMMKRLHDLAKSSQRGAAANLSVVSEQQIKQIHSLYGGEGLFRLIFLASTSTEGNFKHFFDLIADCLIFSSILTAEDRRELECNNDMLRQGEGINRFNLNVLQPSIARKLYNPGSRHGFVVYGLGGPKILVSHPFQGIKGEIYDVYNNSVDVVTSLMMRGYEGTFLFLDYLGGLNHDVLGVPAWLVWYSIIAAHSDLVIFVKEYEEDFGASQKMEIGFTPDRVQKKIVEIPHEELRWAKVPDYDETMETLYFDGRGGSTREAYYQGEAEFAAPLIEAYTDSHFPQDRLIRIDESGERTEYPLDYPIYRP